MSPTAREDQRALVLLISLLVLFLLSPFAVESRRGEIIFLIALYWTFVSAALSLSEKRTVARLAALLLAACSFTAALVFVFHPVQTARITHWAFVASFLGYVSVIFFRHLGKPGRITSGRVYVSVSLYLLLGVFYFAVFNLVDALHPRSFVESAGPAGAGISSYSHLYFSLSTLTTLGYGDIVPVTPLARILAVLEAATGVLYVAITVARLVAAYQRTDGDPG